MSNIVSRFKKELIDNRIELDLLDKELSFKKSMASVPASELRDLTDRADLLRARIQKLSGMKILRRE